MINLYNHSGFWRDPRKRQVTMRLRDTRAWSNGITACHLRVALYKARERLRGRR